ncbi:MAG: hypothetical protein K0R85_2359 [Devosia sp.]|jgi:hypothetical protein|nr:hypothetical protein [Devosia sp.]
MPEPEIEDAAKKETAAAGRDVVVAETAAAPDRGSLVAVQWHKLLRWLRHRWSLEGMAAWFGNLIRRRETWLVVLAVVIGALAGLVVLVLRELAYGMQSILFQLRSGERLSALPALAFDLAFVPAIGGLLPSGCCCAGAKRVMSTW